MIRDNNLSDAKTVHPVCANDSPSHVATPSKQRRIYLKRHLFRSLYLSWFTGTLYCGGRFLYDLTSIKSSEAQ